MFSSKNVYKYFQRQAGQCWSARKQETKCWMDLDQLPLRSVSRSQWIHHLLDLHPRQVDQYHQASIHGGCSLYCNSLTASSNCNWIESSRMFSICPCNWQFTAELPWFSHAGAAQCCVVKHDWNNFSTIEANNNTDCLQDVSSNGKRCDGLVAESRKESCWTGR